MTQQLQSAQNNSLYSVLILNTHDISGVIHHISEYINPNDLIKQGNDKLLQFWSRVTEEGKLNLENKHTVSI